ncbi:MAG TPA: DUF2163 domain-containing protein [Devosia sp.]|nr:DUF2163 domain-containing protein [Devosia sp.]
MREFSTDFANHIASGATTLCNCWLIERTDSAKLGFTDHDEALVFGGQIYEPAHGLDGSETIAKLGAQVDTSEVAGLLHSSAISEDDIVLGRYDGARVTTFRVNWRDVSVRATTRVDTIGEITREDGYFRAELRSQLQALNIAKGRRYQSICDAVIGEARCGVDLEDAAFKTSATVSAVVDRFSVHVSGANGFASGWFAHGKALWLSGKRLDLADPVVGHAKDSGTVSLSFGGPVGDWVSIGDQMTLYAGCDRRFSTCADKFSNALNFQGFPHIPGSDFILTVPKPSDALDGGALIG